jgi:hypothetical protein
MKGGFCLGFRFPGARGSRISTEGVFTFYGSLDSLYATRTSADLGLDLSVLVALGSDEFSGHETHSRDVYGRGGFYLRFGGSPLGVGFYGRNDSSSAYARFNVHAGLGYQMSVWRVFDLRAFTQFGTFPKGAGLGYVDLGGQLSTGITW